MFRSIFLRLLIKLNRKFLSGKSIPGQNMPHDIKASHLLSIGEGTYGAENLIIHSWNNSTRISIGKYCSIADNVHVFLGGNHDISRISTFPFGSGADLIGPRQGQLRSNGHVNIGNDVWIGSHASIMSGISIGDGAVIAAFAHVVRDVEDYEVVGGNPAKHIKYRFSQEIIDALTDMKWWNLPPSKIMENRKILSSKPTLQKLKKF